MHAQICAHILERKLAFCLTQQNLWAYSASQQPKAFDKSSSSLIHINKVEAILKNNKKKTHSKQTKIIKLKNKQMNKTNNKIESQKNPIKPINKFNKKSQTKQPLPLHLLQHQLSYAESYFSLKAEIETLSVNIIFQPYFKSHFRK